MKCQRHSKVTQTQEGYSIELYPQGTGYPSYVRICLNFTQLTQILNEFYHPSQRPICGKTRGILICLKDKNHEDACDFSKHLESFVDCFLLIHDE